MKPTHLTVRIKEYPRGLSRSSITACGLVSNQFWPKVVTHSISAVTCKNCIRTKSMQELLDKEFSEATGGRDRRKSRVD